ncbi:hypothetical protein ACH5RR_017215 [Cinchona calisaya]|uniref:Uncharacterized protein n=1 Tax=Cinchona calisaya TaxID=153742 RepID=A0ABD3A0A0_9GENT
MKQIPSPDINSGPKQAKTGNLNYRRAVTPSEAVGFPPIQHDTVPIGPAAGKKPAEKMKMKMEKAKKMLLSVEIMSMCHVDPISLRFSVNKVWEWKVFGLIAAYPLLEVVAVCFSVKMTDSFSIAVLIFS